MKLKCECGWEGQLNEALCAYRILGGQASMWLACPDPECVRETSWLELGQASPSVKLEWSGLELDATSIIAAEAL